MLRPDPVEMSLERRPDRDGQERRAVFPALPTAHDDLVGIEVDVLHPQPDALEETEARAVKEHDHESVGTLKSEEHGADLVA